MARSMALILCVVLVALIHGNLAMTNANMIGTDMTKLTDLLKTSAEGLKGELTAELPALTSAADVSEMLNLVDALREPLMDLVAAVEATAVKIVGDALTTIVNNIEQILNVVKGVTPILTKLVTALEDLIRKLLEVVKLVLDIVASLLGSLLPGLNETLKGLLVSVMLALSLGQTIDVVLLFLLLILGCSERT